MDSNGRVFFDKFQFKLVTWSLNALELQAAGCMKLLDGDMDVHLSNALFNAAAQAYVIGKAKNWRC